MSEINDFQDQMNVYQSTTIIIDKTIEYIETAPKKYTETGKSPIVQITPIAKSLRMYFICINLSLPCTQS